MRKNTLKKAMAVMISATMLVTGYTVVSAEGFTDAEALAEMDAFTTGDEAVYVEEVQPEQTQTEVQPEAAQTLQLQNIFYGERHRKPPNCDVFMVRLARKRDRTGILPNC